MDLIAVIKRDIRITEYAQRKGYTVIRVGQEFTLKEHDSVRIDPEKNLFIRNADKMQAGSIIDFVMWADDLDTKSAITYLRTMLPNANDYIPRPQNSSRPLQKEKQLELPTPIQGKYTRVFAYLNKTRGIDPEFISQLVKQKMLYEDDHHNCVFVGYDNQKPAFATKRSTSTHIAYRGDASGSRKDVGFFIDNRAPYVFVVEAPIDALSIMTLLRRNNRDPEQYSYLALGGVSEKSLLYHIQKPENQQIKVVYLATDNDNAGTQARQELYTALERCGYAGRVVDKTPKGKDWNDDLLTLLHPAQEKRQEPVNAAMKENTGQIRFDRSIEA